MAHSLRPGFRWDGRSTYHGASLSAVDDLAGRKGYRFVACSLCGSIASFVSEELSAPFEGPFEPERLFHAARYGLKYGFAGGHAPGYGPAEP